MPNKAAFLTVGKGGERIRPCIFALQFGCGNQTEKGAMTFSRKILKTFEWRTYSRLGVVLGTGKLKDRVLHWRQRREQKRVVARRQSLTVENLLRDIPPGELEKVQALSARENMDDVFWTKYLDVQKWLTLNIRYAKELGLVERPPRSVMDLGCGGGFFLVVCRMLGSRVLGLDLDKDLVLNEMVKLFKLERVTWRIRAFVKLPDFKRQFDLITAFMICFNFPPRHPYWGPRQWDFFLNDMSDRLLPDGRLLLSLNKQPDGNEYDDVLKAYFESREGVVTGKRIIFTAAGLKRTETVLATAERNGRAQLTAQAA